MPRVFAWTLAVPALAGALVVGAFAGPALSATGAIVTAEPVSSGGPAVFRRLNEAQYKASIEQIFGSAIKVGGRFDPQVREEGLQALGESRVVISASGLDQNGLRARDIAAQVLAEGKRKDYVPCTPASATQQDVACATQFLGKYGRLLYRRPLTQSELASVLKVAGDGAARSQSFYKGLEIGLSRLLYSPNFIFRVEKSEADPTRKGALRLDSWSLASRVSFLLWNAPPDEELLSAAASGALRQPGGLQRQVDRMIESPRFAQGVRAFFSDMFGFDRFVGLTKDQTLYPQFTSAVGNDAREQALRTIVNLLVTEQGDYRNLFTTRKTFVNRNTAALQNVPLMSNAGFDDWAPYTFKDEEQRAGLTTLPGILMLDPTHEGRSSPTNRGKMVREALLCQKVPDPPGNVDFSAVQDINSKIHKTARQRLTVHRTNPVCAGCHVITDPIGLALENFDAVGSYRSLENGEPIDASGSFEGKPYKNALELGQLLHDSPAIPACLVRRTYEYGVGRTLTPSELTWLDFAGKAFAADQYRLPSLLRRIATSTSFQAVSTAQIVASTK